MFGIAHGIVFVECDMDFSEILVICGQIEHRGGILNVHFAKHFNAFAINLLRHIVFVHRQMNLSDVVHHVTFVHRRHLASYLVHQLTASVVAFDGLVKLSESLISVGQCHQAAGFIEEVADLVVMLDSDFRILHNMLKIIVVEVVKNHRTQNLQLYLILIGIYGKIRFTTYGLVNGNGSFIRHFASIILENREKTVDVLPEKHRETKHQSRQQPKLFHLNDYLNCKNTNFIGKMQK